MKYTLQMLYFLLLSVDLPNLFIVNLFFSSSSTVLFPSGVLHLPRGVHRHNCLRWSLVRRWLCEGVHLAGVKERNGQLRSSGARGVHRGVGQNPDWCKSCHEYHKKKEIHFFNFFFKTKINISLYENNFLINPFDKSHKYLQNT